MADTTSTGGVTIRRFTFDSHIVKIGDTVRCTDNMRWHGKIGDVVFFTHDGRAHPVTVELRRRNGEPGKRRVTFYSWEKVEKIS